MRISVTERQLYKRCRRKWDYSSYNRQSLQPIINAPALDLGTLIHATLAAWTQEPEIEPTEYYSHLAQAHFNQVITSYTERIGCAPAPAELEPLQDAILLGLGMITNYKTKWHTALPPGFTLIENEQTLVQDVQGTQHCACGYDLARALSEERYDGECVDCPPGCCDTKHQLECTFDGVMADANGDLYIIERKTFSRTPSVDELNNNDQFLAYQWALTQQVPNVVGVAYDGLLKRLKPASGKSFDDLFLRKILVRNNAEVEEFGQMLAIELNEMCNPNVPIYKTVPPVQGCQRWECTFMDVCHAQSKGEPYDHLLKMFTRSTRKKHLDEE